MFIIKSLDNKQFFGVICCDMWGFEKILINKITSLTVKLLMDQQKCSKAI